MTKALISSTDIDGIRLDTPMQIPRYFLTRWVPAIKEHAASLGKNNFFVFGEFWCSRERAATMVGRGNEPTTYGNSFKFIDKHYALDGGINYRIYFDFFIPAVKDQINGHLGKIKDVYDADWNAYDFYNPGYNEMRYKMLNFYNNHDQWRISWGVQDGFEKTNLGSAIIAFMPGIPLFYYGDEQGFASKGKALDGWSREGFMTSLAWYDVKYRLDNYPHQNPAVKDNFDMTHPTYKYVQKTMNIRRQYDALQNTNEVAQRWVQPNGENGIYAFTRIWGDKKNWALVAFNSIPSKFWGAR